MSEIDKILLQIESDLNNTPTSALIDKLQHLDNKIVSLKSYLKRSDIYMILNEPTQAERDLTLSLSLTGQDLISKQKYLPSILLKRSILREQLGKFEEALEDINSLYSITKEPSLLQRKTKVKNAMNELKLKEEASEVLEIFKNNQETVPGSKWAVVSVTWFSRWASYVKLAQRFVKTEIPFYFDPQVFTGEHPGPIDNADIINQDQSSIMLQTTASKDICLKSLASENLNYILMPLPAFNYLSEIYTCEQTIIRQAIEINDSMYQVEVFLKLLNLGFFHKNTLSTHTLSTSCKSTLSSLKSIYLAKLNISGTSRLWKINLQLMSIDTLLALLKTNELVYIEGANLLNEQLLVDDSEIGEHDLVFVELQKQGKFLLTDNSKKIIDRCGSCLSSIKLKSVCKKCKSVKYCNNQCMQKDQKEHSKKCKPKNRSFLRCFCRSGINDTSDDDDDGKVVPIENSIKFKEGLTGLQNLGNTCFMNAAIQCLSHTNEITNIFLSGKYKSLINLSNSLGTGGKLVQAYAEVLENLWKKESGSFAPWRLKKLIGAYAPQFIGFQQQDSQELLGFLLDRIHEDLNQVKEKAYFENSEIKGKTDKDVAEESWKRHAMRNQSFIVDLMHGQYKSSLLCPQCNKYSYTFDPFNSLTLPLPLSTEKVIQFYFIFYDGAKIPLKLSIEYRESQSFSLLRVKIAEMLSLNPQSFVFVTIMNDRIKSFVEESALIESVSNFVLFAYETNLEEQQIELQVTIKKGKYMTQSYSRLVALNENNTFIDLNHEIYKKFQHCFVRASSSSQIAGRFENFLEKPAYLTCFVQTKELFCPFCCEKTCKGCPVPYSSEILRSVLKKGFVSILMVWKSNYQAFGVRLNEMNRCTEHGSVLEVSEKSKKVTVKLEDCFELLRTPEKLGKDDSWYCPNCKTHVQATKKMEIYRAPPILILHIKRFKSDGNSKEKVYNPVIFPETNLDISRWVIGEHSERPYNLYAICNHYGNLSGGHYTATCYSTLNRKWFDFKDSLVSESIDFNNAASAYVLFYRQRK